VANDIQLDVIDSFRRSEAGADPSARLKAEEMQMLLEETDDNLDFVGLVLKMLLEINPGIDHRVRIVPGLNHVTERERDLYLSSPPIAWSLAERRQTLARIAQAGHKTAAIDPELGFKEVKLVELESGGNVIEAGTPANFVYIPLDPGLRGYPLGGYQPFTVHPWIPLGNTAVIRGATRNASIVAVQPVRLLMIPKEVYFRYWHATYSQAEFVAQLQAKNGQRLLIHSSGD
jgi:hypothetical protein